MGMRSLCIPGEIGESREPDAFSLVANRFGRSPARTEIRHLLLLKSLYNEIFECRLVSFLRK